MQQSATYSTEEYLNSVSRCIQSAQESLFVHDEALARLTPLTREPQSAWTESLGQLDVTVAGWQAILDAMGDRVRSTQEDLDILEGDLNASLSAFAAARKYLQSDARQAAEAVHA